MVKIQVKYCVNSMETGNLNISMVIVKIVLYFILSGEKSFFFVHFENLLNSRNPTPLHIPRTFPSHFFYFIYVCIISSHFLCLSGDGSKFGTSFRGAVQGFLPVGKSCIRYLGTIPDQSVIWVGRYELYLITI